MQSDDYRAAETEIADDLDARLKSAIAEAVEREEKVGSLSSWWKGIREANHFRQSLSELFSGDD